MKKRVLALLMACTMVFAMSGCGAKEDPAPVAKNEVVQETAEKVETQKEETKEEVKEEAKSEDSTDAAPFHPTSRIQHRGINGSNPIDIPETIEYAADGSYTVTGTFVDDYRDSSFDIVHTYNEKGELIDYILREYGAAFPDGREQQVKLASGYPTWVTYDCKGSAQKTDMVENYTSDFTEDEGISVQDGKITSNYMINYAVDELGNTLPEYYSKGKLEGKRINNGKKNIMDSRMISDFGLSTDTQLSSIVEYTDNSLIIGYVYQGEGYNLETRKNEVMNVYDSVDVLRYNQMGLLESIETFKYFDDKAASIDLNDLSDYEPNSYAYYTYDANGNLLEITGRAEGGFVMNITYSYDDSTSASSASKPTKGTGVVGRWIPQEGAEMYYCIEISDDKTGTLYRADKTYSLKYTYENGKVSIVTDFDGDSIKSEYFYENDQLVSDQDNSIFVRE